MKTIQANVHEAKTNLSKLVQQAMQGDEIIIANAGVPQVKLTPIKQSTHLGVLEGKATIPDEAFAPMTEAELGEWE